MHFCGSTSLEPQGPSCLPLHTRLSARAGLHPSHPGAHCQQRQCSLTQQQENKTTFRMFGDSNHSYNLRTEKHEGMQVSSTLTHLVHSSADRMQDLQCWRGNKPCETIIKMVMWYLNIGSPSSSKWKEVWGWGTPWATRLTTGTADHPMPQIPQEENSQACTGFLRKIPDFFSESVLTWFVSHSYAVIPLIYSETSLYFSPNSSA